MKNVIEKLMTVEKEEMQGIGMDILFWFMDHGSQEILINELNEYLLNKNPKVSWIPILDHWGQFEGDADLGQQLWIEKIG